jgi:hypothetical protein
MGEDVDFVSILCLQGVELMLKGWIEGSTGRWDFEVRPYYGDGCGTYLFVIFMAFIFIALFAFSAVAGWPMLFTEGKPQEAIVVILIVFVSEIVGWVLKKISTFLQRLGAVCAIAGVLFFLYMIVTLIAFPSMYHGVKGSTIWYSVLFGPVIIGGMTVGPTVIIGLILFIRARIKLNKNPLRLLILEKVKEAKETDPDLTVFVESNRVSITTKNETLQISYSEHGYSDINEGIKRILLKDVKSTLGNGYKRINNKIASKQKLKEDKKKEKEKDKEAEYRKWV